MSWLQKAAGMGLPNHPLFWNDPHLASLQDHPGFLGLMSSLRSEHEAFRSEFSRL